jgi:hypothetical protein
MKTLARQRDRGEILARLARIDPGSTRRWGTMSAHEMVCHRALHVLADCSNGASTAVALPSNRHFLRIGSRSNMHVPS